MGGENGPVEAEKAEQIADNLCRYKFNGRYICKHERCTDDPLCSAHRPQTTAVQVHQLNSFVTDALRRGRGKRYYDFRGFHFQHERRPLPQCEPLKGTYDFRNAHFHGEADFSEIKLQGKLHFEGAVFDADALFDEVCLHGDVRLMKAKVSGVLSFEHAYVDGNVLLSLNFPNKDGTVSGHVDVGGDVVFGWATVNGVVELAGAVIGGDATFERASISSISLKQASISGNLNCAHANDIGEIDCEHATIKGNAVFKSAKIQRGVGFIGLVVHNLNMCEVTIGGNLHLESSKRTTTIKGAAHFQRASISGSADFRGAQFGEEADFTRCSFKKRVWFDQAVFEAKSIFLATRFWDDAIFENVTFAGDCNFKCAQFHTRADMRVKRFKGEAQFEGATPVPCDFHEPAKVYRTEKGLKWGTGESFCRFGKKVQTNIGNYDKAGDWHLEERKHAWYQKKAESSNLRCDKKWWQRAKLAFELVVIRGICAYFERPWQIAVISGVLIGGLGLAFAACDAVVESTTSSALAAATGAPSHLPSATPWESIYFSIVTFTTLGFGDFRPMASTTWRLIASGEAVFGAFLMAAFLVSLARRWGRG